MKQEIISLMSRKHKKVCRTLNYIEQFLILTSAITGCTSISAFASLLGIPIVITSSAIGLKICEIVAGIKKFQSTIKMHDKIALNSIKVLISNGLLD